MDAASASKFSGSQSCSMKHILPGLPGIWYNYLWFDIHFAKRNLKISWHASCKTINTTKILVFDKIVSDTTLRKTNIFDEISQECVDRASYLRRWFCKFSKTRCFLKVVIFLNDSSQMHISSRKMSCDVISDLRWADLSARCSTSFDSARNKNNATRVRNNIKQIWTRM